MTLGTPIHHTQCEWHPEFCPAERATPFLPQGCNQRNILGRPCKSLADSLPYLSLSHFLPLSHTGLLSFPKIHQASALSRPLHQPFPTCNAPSFILVRREPPVRSGLTSGICSLERSFLSPRSTAAQRPSLLCVSLLLRVFF